MPNRIYFVRHGKASFGDSSYDKLSDTGQQQAKLLQKIPELNEIDNVYAGSLLRQIDTAKIGFEGYQIKMNEAWNEIKYEDILARFDPDFTDFQKGVAKIYKQKDPIAYFNGVYNKAVTKWSQSDGQDTYVESYQDFSERVARALNELAKQNETVAVVTSAGVIAMITLLCLDSPKSNFLSLMSVILNGSVTCVEIRPQRKSLFYFNNFSHLPENLRSLR